MIILDGLNNLPAQYHDLAWLPLELPHRVHIILSSSCNPKIMEIVKMRSTKDQVNKPDEGWLHIPIQPLTLPERKAILNKQSTLQDRYVNKKMVFIMG